MKVYRAAQWMAIAAVLSAGAGVELRASAADVAAGSTKLAGLWDGTVTVLTGPANNQVQVEVPFPLEIVADGQGYKASFLNGSQKISSTSSSIDGDKVVFT